MDKMAFPLTFLLKQEGDQWAALSPEVTVASCGRTADEARQALEDAIETYVLYMIANSRMHEIERRASQQDVDDFLAGPPGESRVEGYVLLIGITDKNVRGRAKAAKIEFVPSLLTVSAAGFQSVGS